MGDEERKVLLLSNFIEVLKKILSAGNVHVYRLHVLFQKTKIDAYSRSRVANFVKMLDHGMLCPVQL